MSLGPIRLERRLEQSRLATASAPFVAILVGLFLSGAVVEIAGHSAFDTYRNVLDRSLAGTTQVSATLVSATPLLLTGLAAAIAFRARVWNIGGEGQLYIGAIAGTAAGIALGGTSSWIAVPAMVLSGCVGGAVWAAIPAILRAYLHTNEILTSLMLNYVAGLFLSYLIFDSYSYWRDTTSPGAKLFPQGKTLGGAATWPGFVGASLVVPLGFVLAVVLAGALLVYIQRTRPGFALRVVADAPTVARYAGLKPRRTLVGVMLISGAFAGLAGASQVGDFSHVLDPSALLQTSLGYTGIVVAALARFNPLAVVPSALFFGALTNAGLALQGPNFPQGLVGVIEGVILFCLLSSEVLVRYRVGRAGRAITPDQGVHAAETSGTTVSTGATVG